MKVDLAATSTAATIPVESRLRLATRDDVLRIVEMATRFISSALYRDRIAGDPARIQALTEQLVAGESGQGSVVFVAQDQASLVGMIALFVYDHPMSGVKTAVEVAWWIEPEHRRSGHAHRLLEAAETWAKAAGAKSIQMIAPTEEVEQIYLRRGYHQVETTFAKELAA